MVKINLLPNKHDHKIAKSKQELLLFLGGFLIIAMMLLAAYYWQSIKKQKLQEELLALQGNGQSLEKIIAKIQEYKKNSSLLNQRLDTIEQLKRKKNGPAKLLNSLADILHSQPKVWLTNFIEKDNVLVLQGGALEQENISQFQIALSKHTEQFENVTLTLVNSAKDKESHFLLWTITCKVNYGAG